jgi:mannose-6-phosphate isomerase-like protein (cupin superfamily)
MGGELLKGNAVIFLARENPENLLAGEKQETPDFQRIELKEQEGLEIQSGLRHRIANEGDEDPEFILCSQPSTAGDRTNIK